LATHHGQRLRFVMRGLRASPEQRMRDPVSNRLTSSQRSAS
jgi:hypothetical protein